MKSSYNIQNLKCGGCASTILKKIEKIEGISNVSVNVDASEVQFEHGDSAQLDLVAKTLKELGYPIETEENSLKLKAKSFVSCGIGRLGKIV